MNSLSGSLFPMRDGRWERHCDTCAQTDLHPRCIYLGDNLKVTYRHMDCCAAAGCPGGLCGTVLRASRKAHGDALISWLEGRMAALGGDLTAWLKAGAPIMGGASGLDQARVLDFLQVCTGYSANPSSPFTAILANPFTSQSSGTNGGHIRLITTATPSGSNANGSEVSGGSYTAGTGIQFSTGSGGAFNNPSYSGGGSGSTGSGTTASNLNLSQSGMPTVVVGGMEVWDSKGGAGGGGAYASALRWLWCQLQSNISCTSGDQFVFSSGAITATFNA